MKPYHMAWIESTVRSSSSSSAFNVRGPHITQAWDVRHPRWHGSDGCPQQHSVVSCTNSTTFNGSGYTRLCQGSSMNSWLTWGYWYMFLLLKELLQPDGLPAPTHPLGRGVFNETPSHNIIIFQVFHRIHPFEAHNTFGKNKCRRIKNLTLSSVQQPIKFSQHSIRANQMGELVVWTANQNTEHLTTPTANDRVRFKINYEY